MSARVEDLAAAVRFPLSRILPNEQSHRNELRRLEQDLARKAQVQQGELGLLQQKVEFDQQRQRQAIEMQRLEAEAEAARQRALAEVEVLLSHGRVLHGLVTEGLPQIAGAFKQNFGSIHYTQLGQSAEGGPFAMIGNGMAQVLAIAKSFGLDLARLSDPVPPPAPPKDTPPAPAPGPGEPR